MAIWPNRALAACIGLLAVWSIGIGCFNPKIKEGGFLCSDGGQCPEGFQCASDGTCRGGGPSNCQATMPHIEPICTADPGSDCDPVCQSRCKCGRCNLVGTTLACMPAGAKKRGDVCDIVNDDCEPGNICLSDCDGNVARCFRLCGRGSVKRNDVCEGQECDTPVNAPNGTGTDVWVCQPPISQCNPVSVISDCGPAAFSCYISSTGVTACDCRGAGQPGDDCGPYNSCIPGYRCVNLPPITKCFKTCLRTGNDCTAPSSCTAAPGNDLSGQ